jgi:hypothetical protein
MQFWLACCERRFRSGSLGSVFFLGAGRHLVGNVWQRRDVGGFLVSVDPTTSSLQASIESQAFYRLFVHAFILRVNRPLAGRGAAD